MNTVSNLKKKIYTKSTHLSPLTSLNIKGFIRPMIEEIHGNPTLFMRTALLMIPICQATMYQIR